MSFNSSSLSLLFFFSLFVIYYFFRWVKRAIFEVLSCSFQDVMIELYRRNVWNDAKTVNVIVTACFSKVTKVRKENTRFVFLRKCLFSSFCLDKFVNYLQSISDLLFLFCFSLCFLDFRF